MKSTFLKKSENGQRICQTHPELQRRDSLLIPSIFAFICLIYCVSFMLWAWLLWALCRRLITFFLRERNFIFPIEFSLDILAVVFDDLSLTLIKLHSLSPPIAGLNIHLVACLLHSVDCVVSRIDFFKTRYYFLR